MKDTLRISIIKASTTQYMHDEALVHALRDHLSWQEVPRETYYQLARVLPKGAKLVCDHLDGSGGAMDMSIDQALLDFRQENENRKVSAAAVGKAKVAAKKVAKKGSKRALTARQIKELEELRKELGNV